MPICRRCSPTPPRSATTALRAGLTALVERDGGREKARSWWLQVTGDTDLLHEAARLADGLVLWKMRIQQMFAPIEPPAEAAVREAAQTAAQAAKGRREQCPAAAAGGAARLMSRPAAMAPSDHRRRSV